MSGHNPIKKTAALIISILVLSLGACATIDPEFADPRDPYESFNRTVHDMNQAIDEAVLQPVSKRYKAITPEPVDQGITNFFNNMDDVISLVNNVLQFKISRAMEDASRVLINTTFGVGGLFDIASDLEIPRHDEDFGQTLGSWGVNAGPYLVLPLLGPSSGRDALGRVVDSIASPVSQIDFHADTEWALRATNVVDTRADLLDMSRLMEEAALGDTYTFLRDAYLQRRLNAVYDGDPPEQDESF